ncbi:MAG: ubiquinone biosynthesis accessory factor UbiJ [Candidatus Eutrophobiaceae bacterium]
MRASPEFDPGALLEWFARQLLELDPETLESMRDIYGKRIHIRLRHFAPHILLSPSEEAIGVEFFEQPTSPVLADVHLTCGVADFLRMVFGEGRAGTGGNVEICGDLHVLHVLQKALSRYSPDWQEPVSKIIGDPLTQCLESGFGALQRQWRSSKKQFLRDVGEYLCYEKRVIVDSRSLREFCAEVDRLRGDVDRLAAHIQLLEEGRK